MAKCKDCYSRMNIVTSVAATYLSSYIERMCMLSLLRSKYRDCS